MREQTKFDHVSSRWKEGGSIGGTEGVGNGKKDSLSLEGRICNALNDKREVPKILMLMVHTETHKTLLIKEEPTQKNWGKKWKVQYFSGKRKAENKKFRIKRKKIWRGKQKRGKKKGTKKEERKEERRKERR